MANGKLSVIVPAYNEEKRFEPFLKQLIAFKKANPYIGEILVVNDGSTDNTLGLLNNYKKDIKIVSYKKNRGKGYAVKQGLLAATGDYICFMDADVRTAIVFLAQGTGQVAIELDAVQVPGRGRQRRRDGAVARSDFDDDIVGLWSDRTDNGIDYAGVRQEMLAEALARAVFRHEPASSDAATSSAALRLPGSAMPRPAMSRAVP